MPVISRRSSGGGFSFESADRIASRASHPWDHIRSDLCGGSDAVACDGNRRYLGTGRSRGACYFDLCGFAVGANHGGDDESRGHSGSHVVAGVKLGDRISGRPLAGLTRCREDCLIDRCIRSLRHWGQGGMRWGRGAGQEHRRRGYVRVKHLDSRTGVFSNRKDKGFK